MRRRLMRKNSFYNMLMRHKLHNQGSTLLTVVICIAFISILGSLMLSITMTNLQMKMLESKSKKNFYSCETIMEKIRVAVQEVTSETIKDVYENEVLTNYASFLDDNEDDRNLEVKKRVIVKILKTISTANSYDTYDDITSFTNIPLITDYFYMNGYLTEAENDVVSMSVLDIDQTNLAVKLKGVKVEYVNEDNYRTAIESDIVITLPKFSFTEGTKEVNYSIKQPYEKYVLLADNDITSDNLTGDTDILGNVYAGEGGININGQYSGGHKVSIVGDTIVTRGNITVSNTAGLEIGSSEAGAYAVKPVVWANNLITKTSASYPSDSSMTTNIKINNGVSVIKDDLAMEGRNSNVVLSGAYIGYTGTHTSKGSAMMINGSESSLNLSGITSLILAGRAHVSVQNSYLDTNEDKTDTDILTGESIAFKSNQRAYLIPGKYIQNINHNPVTKEDNVTYGTPEVNINDTEGLITASTLKPTNYKIAAKQTGATTLYYYYYNFANGKAADQYFKTYMNLHSDLLNKMDAFTVKDVQLPLSGEAYIVGNYMKYDKENGGILRKDGLSALASYPDDTTLDTAIADVVLDDEVYNNTAIKGSSVGSLDSMYSQLNHMLLIDNTKSYDDRAEVVASKIKSGGVRRIIDNAMQLSKNTTVDDYLPSDHAEEYFTSTSTDKESFWIIDGNVTINPNKVFNGVLIATGNITIGEYATVNGLIVSTGEKMNGGTKLGTITVGNHVTVNGRLATTKNILLGQECNLSVNDTYINDIFQRESNIMNEVFKNPEFTVSFKIGQTASSLVDLTQMISYENWKKIE